MKKKKMIPLTDEENESYEKQKVCYICKKEFNTDENNKDEFNTDENDKMNLSHTIKSEIIPITLEILEELLIVFVI